MKEFLTTREFADEVTKITKATTSTAMIHNWIKWGKIESKIKKLPINKRGIHFIHNDELNKFKT